MSKSPLIPAVPSGIEECAGCCSFCAFYERVLGLLCLEDLGFLVFLFCLVSSILLGSYHLYGSLFAWFLEPWGEDWMETSHLRLNIPSSLTLCTLSDCGSAATVFISISGNSLVIYPYSDEYARVSFVVIVRLQSFKK